MSKKKRITQNSLQEKFDSILFASGFSRLLLGLSGGADSVALLRLMHGSRLYRAGALSVKCVHCNFSLRGAESDRDESFCRELCGQLGIPLQIVRFDTHKEAASRKVSLEVACRDLRYDYFRTLINNEGWQRITVAHHLNDNAETLLLNLMRGSGINGLKGMLPDNGEVFRPLLSICREEILEFLKAINQTYVTDSTNTDSDFRRNFIRNEVLPLLETRWPSAIKSIAHSAELLRREWAMIQKISGSDKTGTQLKISDLKLMPEPETAIYYYIRGIGGTETQAHDIWRTITSATPKSQSGQLWITTSGNRISLERDCLDLLTAEPEPLKRISETKIMLTPEKWKEIKDNKDPHRAWFPVSLSDMTVRRVETGDRMKISASASAKVSKIMKDAQLSRREKESAPIVLSPDGKIVWVAGIRRGIECMLTPDMTTAWQMEIKK